MKTKTWSRREILVGLGLFLPSIWAMPFAETTTDLTDRLRVTVARLLGDGEAARYVGERCLCGDLRETRIPRLLSKLGIPELLSLDTELQGSYLGRRIKDDFVRGRTIQVEGWILSETEAHLCALARLLA